MELTPQFTASKYEILRGLVGSTAYGTGLEGQEDRDELGVFIEPPERVIGLNPLDHVIFRTQPEGVPSGPGDLDLTRYSLRKFMRLAVQGNPSIIVLLWLPDYLTKSYHGEWLISCREALISQEMGKRFLGYLQGQVNRLLNKRAAKVNRNELTERFGYDTKAAMHAARLAYQGLELIESGALEMPIAKPLRTELLDIRQGKLTLEEALDYIREAEDRLKMAVDTFKVSVDKPVIDKFLVEAHRTFWASHQI